MPLPSPPRGRDVLALITRLRDGDHRACPFLRPDCLLRSDQPCPVCGDVDDLDVSAYQHVPAMCVDRSHRLLHTEAADALIAQAEQIDRQTADVALMDDLRASNMEFQDALIEVQIERNRLAEQIALEQQRYAARELCFEAQRQEWAEQIAALQAERDAQKESADCCAAMVSALAGDVERLTAERNTASAIPALPPQQDVETLAQEARRRLVTTYLAHGHVYTEEPEKEIDILRDVLARAALARRAPADQTDVEAMVERLRAPGIHRTQTVLEAARMLEDMAAVPPAPADQGQRETLEQIAQAEAGSLLGGFDYTGPISRQDIERRILAALQRAREAE